jgi:transforming growth factor-beta-induced protein
MTTPLNPHPTHRRLRWLAASALAILLAGACGSDDDTATADRDGTSLTTLDVDLDELEEELTETGAQAQSDLEQALRDLGLTNLASAVSQVDLSEVLDDNEFTVFAPDDSAFLALDGSDLSDLLRDPASILDLLQNHLVIGEALSIDDLADMAAVTSEAGVSLAVTETGGTVTIEGATVTNTETVGAGVIHVVDQVLILGAAS